MSYHQISRSLEAARYDFRGNRSLWTLTGAPATLLPRHLSEFRTMQLFQNPISRLQDLRRFGIRHLMEAHDWNQCHIYKRDLRPVRSLPADVLAPNAPRPSAGAMLTGNHYWACLRQSFFGYKWFWKSVCYQSLHKMADAISRDIAVLPSFKLSGPVLQALVALKEYRDAAVELRGLVKDPQQVNLPTYEVHVHTYRWLSARLQ